MLTILPASVPGSEPPEIDSRARAARDRLRSKTSDAARRTEVVFVPGRIEVLGKHTDYAGGVSLTCATRQGICLAVAPRRDRRFAIDALDGDLRVELDLDRLDGGEPSEGSSIPRVLCRRMVADFGSELHGADVVFGSDLPAAAGMSSSSALLAALFLGLAAANRLGLDRLPSPAAGTAAEPFVLLASYLAAVERGTPWEGSARRDGPPVEGGAGMLGGSEDSTAILCSRRGELGLYRYAPIARLASVPLPPGWVFGLAVSGVDAAQAAVRRDAFNRVSRLASAAIEVWRRASGRADPHLASALEAAGADGVRAVLARHPHPDFAPDELVERFDQFVVENELVQEAGAALARRDLEAFSAAAGRSQRLAEDNLHNQIPETVFLARRAVELGAAAASAFGAGFGGSVWALVREDDTDRFLAAWQAAALARFPRRAASSRFLASAPAPAARRLVFE